MEFKIECNDECEDCFFGGRDHNDRSTCLLDNIIDQLVVKMENIDFK